MITRVLRTGRRTYRVWLGGGDYVAFFYDVELQCVPGQGVLDRIQELLTPTVE